MYLFSEGGVVLFQKDNKGYKEVFVEELER